MGQEARTQAGRLFQEPLAPRQAMTCATTAADLKCLAAITSVLLPRGQPTAVSDPELLATFDIPIPAYLQFSWALLVHPFIILPG